MYEIAPLKVLCQKFMQKEFGEKILDSLATLKLLPKELRFQKGFIAERYKIIETLLPVYSDSTKFKSPWDPEVRGSWRKHKQQPQLIRHELGPRFLSYQIVTVGTGKEDQSYIMSASFRTHRLSKLRSGKYNDSYRHWVDWEDTSLIDKYIDTTQYSHGN